MIATPSPIPPPRPDDDEDVHWALSTASALWARGDAAESIKWLRRAAETASDQNRDQRSLELFKAAADATSMIQPMTATAPLPAAPNPAPPAPARPGVGPTGTISMQVPPVAGGVAAGQGGQGGGGASPAPPPVRPSAPMPPPQPPGRVAGGPPRAGAPPGAPGGGVAASGGPPAGTARAAAAQANAQARGAVGAPGFGPQRPPGAALPGVVSGARQVLKATLPSEGSPASRGPAPQGARPGAVAPSSAAKRHDTRKQPLDARFQFPDEEVTVQRDLASLKKPRPVHTELATDDAAAAAAAATQRAPAAIAPVAARTLISSTSGTPARSAAARPTADDAGHGMIANEATSADPEPTPLDDLDEQTSVLAGDEPELDFEGSQTGETPAAMLASIEQNALDHGDVEPASLEAASEEAPSDDGASAVEADDASLDDGVTGDESSDPRHGGLSAPSVRPEPMRPEPMRASASRGVAISSSASSSMPAVRVAVSRDATGLRVEPLARGARPRHGAVAAVLVAQDDASADALARLLDA